MNKIEKLIEELCPEGVEFKRIGEICQINRGRVMSKDYLRNNVGEYPVYSSQTVDDGVFGRINTYDYDGEYLTWTTDGANAGSIFYRNGKFNITNVCGLLKVKVDSVNTKFLLYILATVSKKYVSAGMGNPKIMSNVMEKIKIPIPPLTIQKEIVKILDNFTQLEAELEAELEARKKQYEHYREQLLMVNDEGLMGDGTKVEFRALGEFGKLVGGSGLPKTDFTDSGIACIHYGQIYTHYGVYSDKTISFVSLSSAKKLKKVNQGDLIIAKTSENVEDVCKTVAWLGNDEIVTGGHTAILNHEQNPKYLSYYINGAEEFQTQKRKYTTGVKVKDVSLKNLAKIKIPIPPISKQKEIVAILDKFDALVNDISTGLPAEIAARKKQYEYYRNQLLEFRVKS